MLEAAINTTIVLTVVQKSRISAWSSRSLIMNINLLLPVFVYVAAGLWFEVNCLLACVRLVPARSDGDADSEDLDSNTVAPGGGTSVFT